MPGGWRQRNGPEPTVAHGAIPKLNHSDSRRRRIDGYNLLGEFAAWAAHVWMRSRPR
jgi:hypothetical protein